MLYASGKAIGEAVAVWVDGVRMTERQATVWRALKAAAAADGVALQVNSALRTYSEQAELYRQWKAGESQYQAAQPGFSRHQNGLAFDFQVHASTSSREYQWLAKNGSRFGLMNTGAGFSTPEFHHWELTA